MYTWELERYIKERGRILTRDEYYKVVNRVDNPQIKDVTADKNGIITMRMEHDEILQFKCRTDT